MYSSRFAHVLCNTVIAALCCVASQTVAAENEIRLVSPKQYQVFQRRSMHDGYIRVSGSINSDLDKLQIRISGKSLKGNLSGKWQALPFVKQTRSFTSVINVISGGWYRVDLQALCNNIVVAQASVDKVGVGEVFVGAGQSNSTNCGQEIINQTSGMVSSFSGSYWQIANDPQPGSHDKTMGGSFWPAFGDAMYEIYHVPIGVAVTGQGMTTSAQWQPDAPDGLYPWMMTRIYQLTPQGFRALLWHQGETDAHTPTDTYVKEMTTLITRSTEDAGWVFPWFVANASYHSPTLKSWPLVRAGQQKLWELGVSLEGPDTDTLVGDNRDFDGNGIHFSPKGLRAHGKMWADKVSVYLDKVLETK